MNKVILGQTALIICCGFYLVWWYRGYRPGVTVNRIAGLNGVLLLITAVLGITGIVLSLMNLPDVNGRHIPTNLIVIGGIIAYFALLIITRFAFHRIVTTELVLITAWTMLEVAVTDRLYAAGMLGQGNFTAEIVVIAAAFLISMVLYVAYYRMEENAAFYAAMVPLITEAAAMAVLVAMTVGKSG